MIAQLIEYALCSIEFIVLLGIGLSVFIVTFNRHQ